MSLPSLQLPEEMRNVGGVDRLLRVVASVVLVAVGALAVNAGRGGLAGIAFVGAAGLLFNAATGFCGINAALGIDTRNE
jgi:hypothetical protein